MLVVAAPTTSHAKAHTLTKKGAESEYLTGGGNRFRYWYVMCIRTVCTSRLERVPQPLVWRKANQGRQLFLSLDLCVSFDQVQEVLEVIRIDINRPRLRQNVDGCAPCIES